MIKFDNVNYSINGTQIIKNFSLEVQQGEFIAVIGANGAGKSTISRLTAGLLKPSSGTILVNGKNTKTEKASNLAKDIAFLFQNPDRQICQNTVREELLFGLEIMNTDIQTKKERLHEIQEYFQFNLDAQPFSLSRGQRQRLALASVLIKHPKLLILDEPTTGLDHKECIEILDYVQKLNEKGTTVFMVSHDMELVQDYAKTVLCVNKGENLAHGSCFEIMRNKELLTKASVKPAQISALAISLGEEFYSCKTAEELAEMIERRCL